MSMQRRRVKGASASAPGKTRLKQNGGPSTGQRRALLPEKCLICNAGCCSRSRALALGAVRADEFPEDDGRDIREVLYRAFDIHVDESYFEETDGDLPLCKPCTRKCEQLKEVAFQLEGIQREFNRLREDIAFAIVDTVASNGNGKSSDHGFLPANFGDKKVPKNNLYKKVRNCEVELIQQLIFESWHDRFPSEYDDDDSYYPYDDYKVQTEKEPVFTSAAALKSNSMKTKSTSQKSTSTKASSSASSTSSRSTTSPPVGKTTIISITTRDDKPSTSTTTVRRQTAESDESGSMIEKNNVEFDMKNRQITITNGKGEIVKNSSVGLKDEDDPNDPMVMDMSPGHLFPHDFSPSPDYLLGDSDFDDADIDAEYDMDQLVTPQLNLSAELLKHSNRVSGNGKSKKSRQLPDELEITHWDASGGGGSSDESQQRLTMDLDYENLVEEDDGRTDDITLEDFEDGADGGAPGLRNGRSESSSSENPFGSNSNDIEYQQNEEGLYVCMFCSKTFIHKYPYRDHLKTHTGEGPRCPVCNKIFPKNHNLMLHMRTHTGEKPYKCEVCRKGFADKSNLKVHMRVHTGERPYKCEYCDQAFVNSSRLVVHRRLHTGDRPFECDVRSCTRTFSTSNQLQSHRKIHFAPKPFSCEMCGKGYSNATSLTAHINHYHGTD